MTTVGEFLKEKAGNMARWLKDAGCPLEFDMGSLHPLQLVVLAQNLPVLAIDTENFAELLADKENLPPELGVTVSFIETRPELHDKFWRYLKLFSDTVQ